MGNCSPDEFLWLFQRVVHKYGQFEEQSRYYGTDRLITVSEIHTIDVIGNQEAINLTGVAKALGITKGSASQMVYKLVDKGLVIKKVAPNSDREIVLYLTEIGKTAFEGHKHMHLQSGEKMSSIVRNMPQDVLDLAKDYMVQFEGMLDKLLEENDPV